MNVLLIYMPSRKGKTGFKLPLSLLYVGGIIERSGHRAIIVDPQQEDIDLNKFDSGDFNRIDEVIEEFEPGIVGFGGISTSYGRTKILSQHIKAKYPYIFQIAGGALASVYDLLLTKTAIDLVFHGESEITLAMFLEKFDEKIPYYDIPGISFLHDGKAIRNIPAKQIEDIDTVPFPAYHLVDIYQYLPNIEEWLNSYHFLKNGLRFTDIVKRKGRSKNYIMIETSRGCTHRCLFCYRHMHGFRQHSVAYVIKHIKYLKETYGIEGFQFGDELFNANIEWVMSFCDELEKEDINIFYQLGGARVDNINEKVLRRLKETGCMEINYGQESGSDLVLKEYRKGVSSRQNREVTLLTQEAGLHCPVQIVIGSPGETDSTIKETIQFLKSVNAYHFSLNYLIPLPETPIWKYVMDQRMIPDVERYLDMVAEHGGDPLINLTKAPDNIWASWGYLMRRELELYYLKNHRLKYQYYKKLLLFMIVSNIIRWMPAWLVQWARYSSRRMRNALNK